MEIDRCVCIDKSFAALLQVARHHQVSLESLSQMTGCCQTCGLCRPYLKEALRTGQVVFFDIIVEQAGDPGKGGTPPVSDL